MDNARLLSLAFDALKYSYSPFSNYKVGAALLCKDGSVYTGCNVENSSYGASICAERTALVKAVSEGKTEFAKIAVVNGDKTRCLPCGICRQMLFEFAPQLEVICFERDGVELVIPLSELLLHGFRLK